MSKKISGALARRSVFALVLIALIAALLLSIVLAVCVGSTDISARDILGLSLIHI